MNFIGDHIVSIKHNGRRERDSSHEEREEQHAFYRLVIDRFWLLVLNYQFHH